MKNSRLNIALLFLIITFTSCNKITENIQQDIFVKDTTSFYIPILSTDTSSVIIPGIPSTLDLENLLRDNVNNFRIDQVNATKLTSYNLVIDTIGITKDSTFIKNNFGKLAALTLRIATGGTVSNIARTNIPSTSVIRALSLTSSISPDSLKSLLITPSKTYNVIVRAKAPTTAKMKVKVSATYTVTLSK